MIQKIYYLKLTNSNKVALVDEKWFYICRKYKWKLNSKRYPKCKELGLLHRFVCGLKKGDGMTVHHRNHDHLDSRRSNLQILSEKDHREKHRKSIDKGKK